ncbi:MAG: (2Fe-2S)-binding protein, partial [Candidatus Hodarchaeales archaeon]
KKEKWTVKPSERLVDVLRKNGYFGVKIGCEEGACGSCTVILDDLAVKSCMILAVQVNNRKLVTIEGLKENDVLHPLQEAFIDSGAVQCGYCTPGAILSAKALLDRNSNPTEEEIKVALNGNYCRCTGYVKQIEAVQIAARKLRGE